MISVHIPHTIANAVLSCNSGRLFGSSLYCASIGDMDIYEQRRARLRAWIDEDPIAQGNVEAWCDSVSKRTGTPVNPSYIRQLIPTAGRKANRNIGEKAARNLEKAAGMPDGYLDGELRPAPHVVGERSADHIDPDEQRIRDAWRKAGKEGRAILAGIADQILGASSQQDAPGIRSGRDIRLPGKADQSPGRTASKPNAKSA